MVGFNFAWSRAPILVGKIFLNNHDEYKSIIESVNLMLTISSHFGRVWFLSSQIQFLAGGLAGAIYSIIIYLPSGLHHGSPDLPLDLLIFNYVRMCVCVLAMYVCKAYLQTLSSQEIVSKVYTCTQ